MGKALDIEAFNKALEEDLANPNGYWNKLKRKRDAVEARFPMVENYINLHGMKSVIDRMVLEHGEDWGDKCWAKGYEAHPNNKLSLLLKWVEFGHEPIHNELLPQDFLSASYFVKGYWFCVYCGQGCFREIYDSELNLILHV